MKYNFDQVVDRQHSHSFKWQLGGRDVLPMWIADMDFQAPKPVMDAIIKRAEHGIYGYSMPEDGFFDAVINWQKKRHGWNIDKDWITFCPGIVPGLNMLVRAMTHPGDKVIVQTPVYYPFFDAILNNGRQFEKNPLILENGKYRMDYVDLQKRAEDPRAKAIILCSPHNPVGRVWSRDELRQLGQICLENDIIVISDELHCDLVFKGHQHIPFAAISTEFAENSVTCIAPSKTFNLAGLQTSTLVIPNESIRNLFLNGSIFKRTNPFGIVALEAAYTHGEAWLDQLKDYLEDNIRYLCEFVKDRLPGIGVIKPEGTYLVWMDFRSLALDNAALEDFMLNKAGIWLDEGHIFGKEGDGFERINVACPRSILEQGLIRIETALKNL